MGTQQFNTRLPELTHQQIDELASQYGLTKTQVIIIAIDRMTREMLPDDKVAILENQE